VRNSDSESSLRLKIDVGTESTEVIVYDDGPREGFVLFILHGWGSSANLMQPLSSRLSPFWRTIRIDMPGHGASPPPPSAWGVPQHVELLENIANELQIKECAIIGHSNGGRIALELASRADKRLDPAFLVLNSPSGIKRKRSPQYYVRLWTARILKLPFAVLPGPLKEAGLDWLRHSVVWSWLGSSDYRALSGVMRETFVQTVNHYVTPRLSQITCPVLVFWGTKDDAISRGQMDELVSLLPDAGFFELENAGHYGYLDQPDTIAAAVKDLVGGLPS
jgi:pimeloyl-ACP methyl ester carboxylesterase